MSSVAGGSKNLACSELDEHSEAKCFLSTCGNSLPALVTRDLEDNEPAFYRLCTAHV